MQLAKALKAQSLANKSMMENWADVDEAACVQWLQATGTSVLVHGHTHMPHEHLLPNGLRRMVLSDWDALATPPRLQSLQWEKGSGFSRQALPAPVNA
jgi:UDP-2,3-diacylglucosamine hydrolase